MAKRTKDLSAFPATPFENIALTLSGGGFRSAAFTLGVLTMLHRLRFSSSETLLHQVRYLSTASGGTITGALYALHCHKGMLGDRPPEEWSFPRFYRKLTGLMEGDELLKNAFSQMSSSSGDKARNLINGFARAYDSDLLFDGATFGTMWEDTTHTPLREVCFNATEFHTGLAFRFQTDGINKGKFDERIGNRFLFIADKTVAKRVKLADILAASSCFPAGFEPIVFPRDFSHSELGADELLAALAHDAKQNESAPPTQVGLMDGGIADNQGIASFLLADRRGNKTPGRKFGLVIVSDVSSHFMKSYRVPTEKKDGFWSMVSLHLLRRYLLIANISLAAALVTGLFRSWPAGALAGIGIVCGVHLTLGAAYFGLKRLLPGQGQGSWDKMFRRYLPHFGKIRVSTLLQMVRARASSVLSLTTDVYLKRIRGLIYGELYKDPRWDFGRISNMVYDLSMTNAKLRNRDLKEASDPDRTHPPIPADWFFTPCDAIQQVAEKAYGMSTTLWFTEAEKKDRILAHLIACGQFTTCYNLHRYACELESALPEATVSPENKERIADIRRQLEADWSRFCQDPFFLYQESEERYAPLPGSQA